MVLSRLLPNDESGSAQHFPQLRIEPVSLDTAAAIEPAAEILQGDDRRHLNDLRLGVMLPQAIKQLVRHALRSPGHGLGQLQRYFLRRAKEIAFPEAMDGDDLFVWGVCSASAASIGVRSVRAPHQTRGPHVK